MAGCRRFRTQKLAQSAMHVLRGLVRVALRASVTKPEIEIATLVELQLAPVVVGERLVDGEDDLGARAHTAPVRRAVARDARIPVRVCVRDVEEVVRLV